MIRLYNTLTKNVEPFTPQNPEQVTIYTCGPTVYSEPLIGNWVAYIRWDLLVRALRANGFSVERVMNITDVGHLTSDADEGEDKMQTGARREGKTAWEVAERYTNRFLEGMTVLNLLPPEQLVKATDHIAEQIDLIDRLEKKGHTYVISDGVYFDTKTFSTYSDFARLDLDSNIAGARVEYNSEKRNPSDFALWKFSPENEIRDMEWPSPWGKGFPGWHIECSAMALKYLGETIDIHTGGIDHIPIHHTNEIAQSEAATGKRFANYWLHANFLLANGTKISKSLDNGYTLADLDAKGFSPMDFKMFVLQSHYRTESNFTWENLAAASNRLRRWRAVAALRHQLPDTVSDGTESGIITDSELLDINRTVLEVVSADLNSPHALVTIEKAFDAIESGATDSFSSASLRILIRFIDDLFGLRLADSSPDISHEDKQMILERENSRNAKEWDKSDALRDSLSSRGIALNDTPTGVRWYYI